MPQSLLPYVVTNDLNIVFQSLISRGISPPSMMETDRAGRRIIASLSKIFSRVDVIDAGRILGFLQEKVRNCSLPVISLTEVLSVEKDLNKLEFSRSERVSLEQGTPIFEDVGLMPRHQWGPSLREQFSIVAKKLGASYSEEKKRVIDAALADDVVFSGGTVKKIIAGLCREGISVKKVFASVALQGAIDILRFEGIEVAADYIYPSVIDEVCMRDFLVGAPGGGRNILLPDGLYASAPYILPFGRIEEWASIGGENARTHSLSCLRTSADLWAGLTNVDDKPVTFGDLEKPILFSKPGEKIVEKLIACAEGGCHEVIAYSL